MGEARAIPGIMREVSAAAVPRLGDWCSIYVFDDPEAAPRVEVAHADPAMVDHAREFSERFRYDPRATSGIAAVPLSEWGRVFGALPFVLSEPGCRR